MKPARRINSLVRPRPTPQGRILPIFVLFVSLSSVLFVVLASTIIGAAGVGAVSYYNKVASAGLSKLKYSPLAQDFQPTRILDRKGRLLLAISSRESDLHKSVPFARIPTHLMEAIIASEDKTFYSNPGVDPSAMARALRDYVSSHGRLAEGASTITQQLIKQLVLGSANATKRKPQEIAIAIATTQAHSGFTKNDILTLYLNNVFFGEHAYGVEAASKVFFGKDVWQLDLAQCALLAGLVQSPTQYDPIAYGPDAAIRRLRTHVLPDMVAQHYITKKQARQAYGEALRFKFTEPKWRPSVSQSAAPYWTDWIRNLLSYGPPDVSGVNTSTYGDFLAFLVAHRAGLTSGLTIRTTLDLDTYLQAQAIMRQRVSEIAYNNVNDAAVVVLDPHSAECLAMVGGLDYHSGATGSLINMAAHPRQPGSSFKVFTYLTAFEHGWYPAKMILDEPQTWPDSSEATGVYAPTNYDHQWHGAVSVRMALANSYNIPAVKTISAIGVRPVLQTAIDMGVWHLRSAKDVGLSLTLGAKEVPLWQMAQAYNTIANNGVFRPMSSVLSIDDSTGRRLYTYHRPQGMQVVAPQYTYELTSIMKDNFARVPAFGANSVLQLGPDAMFATNRPAAVKTGTSQDFRDNLTIGFTPNLLTATWVGNPDNQAMNGVEGVDGAGPIWHDTIEWTLQHNRLPVEDFAAPPGVMLARVSSSGFLASQYTPWAITDVFAAGAVPHVYDGGYGNSFAGYRVLGNDFSLDGGTTGSLFTGTTQGKSGNKALGSSTNGSNGVLTYNPGSSARLCPGGGRYTYSPVYTNGRLSGYRYACQ